METNRNRNEKYRLAVRKMLRAFAWLILIGGFACVLWLLFQEHGSSLLSQNLRQMYKYERDELETARGTSLAPAKEDTPIGCGIMKIALQIVESPALAEDTAMPVVFDLPLEFLVQDSFSELYALNPDIVGWLTLPGNFDEPVLHRDNSFYMDHDFNGNYSLPGSLFLDEKNLPTMTDDMLLIYGHNMRSGAMFGDLDNLRSADYLANHSLITLHSIYEPEPWNYVIFSVFDASMNRNDPSYIRIRQFQFENSEEKQAMIGKMKSRSILNIPINADANDQLLMLVTCSYSYDNGRLLVVARKLRPEETPESIAQCFQ